jgi:Isocitrate/isopropylmalate dehydrogenase
LEQGGLIEYLKNKDKYQIAVIPGDGIGKEVMEAAIYVLDSLGYQL